MSFIATESAVALGGRAPDSHRLEGILNSRDAADPPPVSGYRPDAVAPERGTAPDVVAAAATRELSLL